MSKRNDKPQDRRIVRSRSKIHSALFELVREKPYAQISVTELSARAGLNRKTFYAHYSTLDDVLVEIEEQYADTLAHALEDSSFFDTRMISREIVYGVERAVRENYELLSCLSAARSFDVIRDRVESGTREVISQKLAQYPSLDGPGRAYAAQYLAAGMVSVVVHWLRAGDGTPLEEIARIAEQMIFYGVAGFLPPEAD